MSVMGLSLIVAMVACVLLLAALWLFTITPAGRRINQRIEESERRSRPRLG